MTAASTLPLDVPASLEPIVRVRDADASDNAGRLSHDFVRGT